MRLCSEEILSNSFVVSINSERLKFFLSNFEKENLNPLPRKYLGYELTTRYLESSLCSFRALRYKMKDEFSLKQDERLIQSLCNNASHFGIVQHAKLNDLPFVTIFEDDACPIENCKALLDQYCSDIPENIDVLRLGYETRFSRGQMAIDLTKYQQKENLIVKCFCGSQAYIVFKKYYDQFLETNRDNPRCDFTKINPDNKCAMVYALKKPLFVQKNLPDQPVIHEHR